MVRGNLPAPTFARVPIALRSVETSIISPYPVARGGTRSPTSLFASDRLAFPVKFQLPGGAGPLSAVRQDVTERQVDAWSLDSAVLGNAVFPA